MTDHAEVRVEVKVVSIPCVHVLSSSLIVEVLFLEMEPPAKRRIHKPCMLSGLLENRSSMACLRHGDEKEDLLLVCDALPWQSCDSAGEIAPGTCVPGSDPVEMVAPGTRVPGCPTILEQTLHPPAHNHHQCEDTSVDDIDNSFRQLLR